MRYGFVLNQDRCIGCHACTVACKEEHQVPLGVFRTWVKYIEKGAFPHTSRHFGVMRCNHCDAAPCVKICPTNALFRRSDGIIDFDTDRCIGCKSCMQACPYDALYIDPRSNTAAKCNFCAHRVEANLQPACVIVCPTQAILAGDLDNPASNVSQVVAAEKVSVRKPQKGTQPKLFYVGIEGDLLQPTRLSRQNTYAWADVRDGRPSNAAFDPGLTREVYDVAHPAPWGWKIAAYLWTKSIAAGALLVAAMLLLLGSSATPFFTIVSPIIALVALTATILLLIFDLKRPDRFHYLLLKPNFSSWLVLGGFILTGYGLLASAWLICGWFSVPLPGALTVSTAILAIAAACYSASLFAQAKGRDLWQSPLFFWHLLAQALLGGASTLLIAGAIAGVSTMTNRRLLFIQLAALIFSAALTFTEVALPHVSEDVRLALREMVQGRYRLRFWGLAVAVGLVLPIALTICALFLNLLPALPVIASLAVLIGLHAFEDLWVKAGQSVPLS